MKELLFATLNVVTYKLGMDRLNYYILDCIEPKYNLDYEKYSVIFDKLL